MLSGKKIILGVSGSIAAYKAAYLVRDLVKSGADVKVILTKAASDFITPLTFSTLSKNSVYTEFYNAESGDWHNHVDLGLWADLMLIAPASANTISKMANGICDNFLLATYLSAKCPVFTAPAMDLDMYAHAATQDNIVKLKEHGVSIIDAEDGELASGLIGKGRLAEPDTIVNVVSSFLEKKKDFLNKSILITSGPTIEKIDPVRFISNHSSGKMGSALANEFTERGASVTVVSGPVSHEVVYNASRIEQINSAEEMYQASKKHSINADIVIFAAAVADYTPRAVADQKIKKAGSEMAIELIKTKDIAFELGKNKKEGQLFVGFALETNNETFHAQEKLNKKNLDYIVLNSLNDKGAGFKHETNKITIFSKKGDSKAYELKSKMEVAKDIVNEISNSIY